jgi:hypothetical protein
MRLAAPYRMTCPTVHSPSRTQRRRRRWPALGRAALGALVLVASAPGCMRPLTRRLDFVAEQLLVTNQKLEQTNQSLLETRALLDSADRRLAAMQRLLASTDTGVQGTEAKLGLTNEQLGLTNEQLRTTNEQLAGLRRQIQALLGRIPDVNPGRLAGATSAGRPASSATWGLRRLRAVGRAGSARFSRPDRKRRCRGGLRTSFPSSRCCFAT